MNPQLARLQPYPFERLRALFAGITPNAARRPINLSLGEPKHPTPPLILEALAAGAKGLANYPTTAGPPALREAIAAWLSRRHALGTLDPALSLQTDTWLAASLSLGVGAVAVGVVAGGLAFVAAEDDK